MFDSIFKNETFLGKSKKKYFEGWYFKHSSENFNCAFIVGVSKNDRDEHCFIQYIDQFKSHYFKYNLSDFSFKDKNMEIKILNNTFSTNGIYVDLKNEDLTIQGTIKYFNISPFKKSLYCPSIMGPFSYLAAVMDCNHSIISMSHNIDIDLLINGSKIQTDGLGYIEKDFGNKFPKNYLWLQGQNANFSIVFAIAYPLIFNLKGYICLIQNNNKQYNYSLYTNTNIKKLEVKKGEINIILKKGKEIIEMNIDYSNDQLFNLIAPTTDGAMELIINESIKSNMQLKRVVAEKVTEFSLPVAFELVGNFK